MSPEARKSRNSGSDAAERLAASARSFWSGVITFGLVSVPVDLFPASRRSRVSLRMLDPSGVPLARRFYCPAEEREVPAEEIVRGYEVGDGEFVVVTDEELEALEPEKTREIDLRRFVGADEIDPIYFDRAYFLTPAGSTTKAYRLLAETMERTGRAGIATFVMRGKEYLVAILAENGILRAETLRFAEEVRSPGDIGLPEEGDAPAAEVRRMKRAIADLEAGELELEELRDVHAERLLELVERKREEDRDVVHAPEAARGGAGAGVGDAAGDEEEDGDVIDLMELLKARMRGAA